jgi:hypothetical protein
MAYGPNDLRLVICPVGGAKPRLFVYTDTASDGNTAIVTAGYFSDGVAKGMRTGDLIDAVAVGTALHMRYQVTVVSGTTVTVAQPTTIS